jgi:hypothetical protein
VNITRFVATADGGSRFEDIEIPMPNAREDAAGHTLLSSNAYTSPGLRFVELPEGMSQAWHQAPARQIVVVLSGTLEVMTTDDAVRRWSAGEAFIAADVTGQGHETRTLDGPVRVLFAPLSETFSMETWSES